MKELKMSRFTERLQNTSRSRGAWTDRALAILCRETLGASPLWGRAVIQHPGRQAGASCRTSGIKSLGVTALGLARSTRSSVGCQMDFRGL